MHQFMVFLSVAGCRGGRLGGFELVGVQSSKAQAVAAGSFAADWGRTQSPLASGQDRVGWCLLGSLLPTLTP